MKKDKLFSLVTIAISIVATIFIYLLTDYYEAGFKTEMYILPAAGFMLGLLIYFTDFESMVGLDEVIDELPESLADDAEKLLSGNLFTIPIITVTLTTVAFLLEMFLIFYFRKWNAKWWEISVLFVACISTISLVYFFLKTGWFDDRHFYSVMDPIKFTIPAVGFAICLLLGIFFAEPIRYGERSAQEQMLMSRSDYADETRGGQIINVIVRSGSNASSSIDFDDCDECAAILIVILLVVASAVIPHFWLVATLILLTWMAMVVLRYLVYNPQIRSRRRY